jgi:transcriptional regulator with XRE-family HTH domain
MKERIQQIINHEQITPSKFADIIGVQRSSVSHILSGRNNPGLDFLSKILQHFPMISGDWLITGKGSMLKDRGFKINQPSLFATTSADAPRVIEEATSQSTPNLKEPEAEAAYHPLPKEMNTREDEQPLKTEAPVALDTGKRIDRIVVFYSDRTFREYQPE